LGKIIIFSENLDHTTSKIIRWLNHYGRDDILRINIDDPQFNVLSITSDCAVVSTYFGDREILKKDLVWFRRSANTNIHLINKRKIDIDLEFSIKFFKQLEKDKVLESLYCWILKNCKSIADPFFSSSRKLDSLIIANEIGIKTPNWMLCSSKMDLINFIKKNNKVVQKTFNHFHHYNSNDKVSYFIYTHLIENPEEYENYFDTSFFQEYIEKSYEIRTFFWGSEYYSMAIFSQNDSSTKVDFRNYNNVKPNRRIPIDLPTNYLVKLKKLMKRLNLFTGSIDILVSQENDYFFLEVNPIGQFGMVSVPNNYRIEKNIAESLIKKSTI
jgi:ATP-GRASP peptide maturase of grasp-with-spasm system